MLQPTGMFLGGGRKPESSEETHVRHGDIIHTNSMQVCSYGPCTYSYLQTCLWRVLVTKLSVVSITCRSCLCSLRIYITERLFQGQKDVSVTQRGADTKPPLCHSTSVSAPAI